MESKDYIINKIDELVLLFPEIRCRYYCDYFDQTHIVEISPIFFYNFDEEFQIKEVEIYEEFFILFPFIGLFITDKLSDFVIEGKIFLYNKEGKDFKEEFTS